MMIVSILIVALLFVTIYVASHRLSGLQIVVVLAVFLMGVAMVASPQLAQAAAQLVGIGRGTDLLVYLSIVVGLFVSANFYFRLQRQEVLIIRLARSIALRDPQEPQ